MYIEKRWFVPGALSLFFLSGLFLMALSLGSRLPQASGNVRPVATTGVGARLTAPQLVMQAAQTLDPAPCVIPAADVASSAGPSLPTASPVTSSPEEVVDIATSGSGATQINTRGFGDVGLQFQDVTINGSVTMVHISNQGNNNNTTDVNIGDNDRIVSEQDRLQSDRTDATPVLTAASTDDTPGPANTPTSTVPAPPPQAQSDPGTPPAPTAPVAG